MAGWPAAAAAPAAATGEEEAAEEAAEAATGEATRGEAGASTEPNITGECGDPCGDDKEYETGDEADGENAAGGQ